MATTPSSPGLACEHCGYSLTGLASTGLLYTCPECGRRTEGRPAGFPVLGLVALSVVATIPVIVLLWAVLGASRPSLIWSLSYACFLAVPAVTALRLRRRLAAEHRPDLAEVSLFVVLAWICMVVAAGVAVLMGWAVWLAT